MRYLTVDQGNTKLKAALWENGKIISNELAPADRGIWCSVADELPPKIEKLAPAWIILNSSTPLPLKINYDIPSKLGPDRIAAATGALELFPKEDILIVDVGTAITYDCVKNGTFIGGNIGAGIEMQLKALHQGTAHLPFIPLSEVERDNPKATFGKDTFQAMVKGVLQPVVAVVEKYHSILGENSHVVLTGGNASLISQHLNINHIMVPNLIMRGLYSILKFNETSR